MASTSNQVPPGDIAWQMQLGCALSLFFSTVFYVARISSRWVQDQSMLSASDVALTGALICCWGVDITMLWSLQPSTIGMGKHQDLTDIPKYNLALQALIAIETIYIASLAFVKISFLLLFKQLFPGRGFHRILYAIGAIVVIWFSIAFFLSVFGCNPVYASWDALAHQSATCIASEPFYIGAWVPNIATDLAILVLPQFHVWKLHVNLKTKFALAGTFLLGGFAIIASVVRFTTLFQIDESDMTWSLVSLGVWTATELAAAIASACMPTMRPVVRAAAHRFSALSSRFTRSRSYAHELTDQPSREEAISKGGDGSTAKRKHSELGYKDGILVTKSMGVYGSPAYAEDHVPFSDFGEPPA